MLGFCCLSNGHAIRASHRLQEMTCTLAVWVDIGNADSHKFGIDMKEGSMVCPSVFSYVMYPLGLQKLLLTPWYDMDRRVALWNRL